jgi:hypothetical protein
MSCRFDVRNKDLRGIERFQMPSGVVVMKLFWELELETNVCFRERVERKL